MIGQIAAIRDHAQADPILYIGMGLFLSGSVGAALVGAALWGWLW
ncbi:hypothetical protein [Sulfitobacter sp. SH24]